MKQMVLLIDDSITIHRVVDLSIDLDKFDIVKVFSEETAAGELKNYKFDYILLDSKLENIDLTNYIKQIKNLQPDALIILLVGAFDKFDPKNVEKIGAHDFLMKPFDSSSLNKKLTKQASVSAAHVNPAPLAQKISGQETAKPSQSVTTNNKEEPPKPEEKRLAPDKNLTDTSKSETDFDPEDQFAELAFGDTGLESDDSFGLPTFTNDTKPKTAPENISIKPDAENKKESFQEKPVTPPITKNTFVKENELDVKFQEEQEKTDLRYKESVLADNQKHLNSKDENQFVTGQMALQDNENQEEFYQLDEDELFNKPAGKILETEILNVSAPVKSEQEKPIAQKFEENILSIDEPDIQDFLKFDDADEPVFQAAVIDEAPSINDTEKPIAQKFEEEVLSLSEPDEVKEEALQEDNSVGENNLSSPLQTPLEDFGNSGDDLGQSSSNKENILKIFDDKLISTQVTEPHISFTPDNNSNVFDAGNSHQENNIQASPSKSAFSFEPENTNMFDEPVLSVDADNDAYKEPLFKEDEFTKEFANDIFPRDEAPVFSVPEKKNNVLFEDFNESNIDVKQTEDTINTLLTIDDAPVGEPILPDTEILKPTETLDTASDLLTIDDDLVGKPIFPDPEELKLTETLDNPIKPELKMPHSSVSNIKDPLLDDTLDLDKLLEMDLGETPSFTPPKPAAPKAPIEPEVSVPQYEAPKPNPNIHENEKPVSSKAYEVFEDQVSEQISEKIAAKSSEEDLFSKLDTVTPVSHKPDTNFDLIKMDLSPAAKEQKSSSDSVFSGITVTIGRDEIMKMLGNAIDKTFLEKAVKEVLAQNMREIVQAVVPAIAEKFIKEEIEKLKDEGE